MSVDTQKITTGPSW